MQSASQHQIPSQIRQKENIVTQVPLEAITFPWAGQPDMVRSLQKDEYYKAFLHQQVHQVALYLLGSRRFSKYEREIAAISELSYYVLTTMLGQQTLGEEYCDIVQTVPQSSESTLPKLPGLSKRTQLVSLRVLLPYVLERLLVIVLRKLSPTRSQEFTDKCKNLAQFLFRFHLALFYMSGKYLEISKRLARIKYIYTGRVESMQERPSYAILGLFILFQQAISLYLYGKNTMKQIAAKKHTQTDSEQEDADNEDEGDSETSIEGNQESPFMKCSLCLNERNRTTATACGHLFCWSCITSACAHSATPDGSKCPICRQPVKLQHLVRIYHYDKPQKQGRRLGG